jgi:ABC-type multidrug transport system ATPase subunit
VESTFASARPFDDARHGPVAALRDATVVLDDRPVLRRVTLELEPGITVLRGANGSGKTTTLRALAGLVPLARGSRDVPRDVLYLGHRPQLLHGLTVRENLEFLKRFRGLTARVRLYARDDDGPHLDGIDIVLDRWGLLAERDRPVEHLSAGQRRRASLARLDLETCELLLLDEPFAELDADAAALLRDSLEDAARWSAVVVASHGHVELDAIATRVFRLEDGALAVER